MSDARPVLVTSALPYANGPLHLGHLAGAYLPADLYVRYLRLKGRDVVYVCGSDEHGVAILIRAMQEGTSPQAVVDRYHAQIAEAFARLGIAFDHYGRTSDAVHHETSQAMFTALARAGVFTRRTEEQLFDPEAGLFLADRFVRGTCPVCGYEEAYGDQCERCGTALSPDELVAPRSALSGAVPERRASTHWYLPLGAMQPRLEAWIGTREGWKANVLGQVRSWFADGLADRAMTRDLPWGVPVPPEALAETGEAEGKVLYVWFEAPIGYVSITRDWAARTGDPERWRRYWQVHEDGTEPALVHFIGKDNIVFHTLIFPALLMAMADAEPGARYVLPENVPANEFLNLEGQKLSTSRGWAVWVHEALDAFPPDVLRYGLAATLPETRDADFSWAEFQARVNGELADVLGNFVHRALTFAQRFSGGAVPPLRRPTEADREALAAMETATRRAGEAYERFRLREAVQETMNLARVGNKHFNDAEPWKTRTSDPEACAGTIHVALQLCASLAVLLEPVVPEAAARLRAMLRLDGVRRSTPGAQGRPDTDARIGWDEAAGPLLPVGHVLGTPEVLFAKIEDAQIQAQRDLLARRAAEAAGAAASMVRPHGGAAPSGGDAAGPDAAGPDGAGAGSADHHPAASALPYAPLAPQISFDQFTPLDLRVGRIVAAEPHPRADKLLRFDVDLGFETRQILSGVRAHVTPEEMLGRQVVVLANLAPRTIRGLESNGMILFAEDRDGRLVPVETAGEPGGVVR